MVVPGKLPPRTPKVEMHIDQYSLIEVHFNDEVVQARPYEFDGDDKAVRYTTTCPTCGQGKSFHISEMKEGNALGCFECTAGMDIIMPPFEDPFLNPVIAGLITEAALIPGLADLAKPLIGGDDDKSALDKLSA